MQKAKSSQPGQVVGQVKPRGMPGLERDGQPQYEKYQSINKIDDFVIYSEYILDEVHR
jgi:hypothetical protein